MYNLFIDWKVSIYFLFLFMSFLLTFQRSFAQSESNSRYPRYLYNKPVKGALRILTYNVKNGVGMDDVTNYQRTAEVINAVRPDVVAIQELDSCTTRSRGVDVLKTLAEKCGMSYCYGASISYRGGKYGIGILSIHAPLKTSFVRLPGREEKRGLLIAEFDDFVVFCTHFSLTEADRIASIAIINSKAADYHKKIYLAGDLNASLQSDAIRLLTDNWVNLSGHGPTFPSPHPSECIDYIFGLNCCRFIYNVVKQEVVPENLASDHRPLFVDVE